ncbi:hypothetical protein C8Q76DRAFT_789965 [Earliella scabrosa]|nr:hypothetical protein C8Q76DRAFT_789965 [Earliella scabrosa]
MLTASGRQDQGHSKHYALVQLTDTSAEPLIHPKRLLDLPAEVISDIADMCNLVDCLDLRTTCHMLYHVVNTSLRRGLLAISFVDQLTRCIQNGRKIATSTSTAIYRHTALDCNVSGQTVFSLKNGRTVVVYSNTVSPCSPLSHSMSSALLTFVTEHSFACAYLRLTLRRRALLSDIRIGRMDDTDKAVFGDLAYAGFSFAHGDTVEWVHGADAEAMFSPQFVDTVTTASMSTNVGVTRRGSS